MMRRLIIAAACAALGFGVAIAQPNTAPAVTAADWQKTLTAVKAGDVIDLGAREVQFARQTLAPAECCITIRGGIFRGNVTLDSWRNVIIDGAKFDFSGSDGSYQIAILAYSPENLTLRNIEQVGTVLPDGQVSVTSLSVRGGKNVTVENSRFHDSSGFIAFQNTDGVKVIGNDIWNVREGINIAGAQNVTVRANRIGPFIPSKDDHPDGIQSFTAGLTQGARNVLIEGNLVIGAGNGFARAQCIWSRDEAQLFKTGAGFAHYTIRGNVCAGTGWHGVGVQDPIDDLTIEGNTLLRLDGADTVKNNWIWTQTGRVINNRAPTFTLAAGVEQSGNVTTGPSSQAEVDAAIADWDKANRTTTAEPPKPVPTPTPSPSPTPSKALERAQKARQEANDLKNGAARALYAIDQLIAELTGGK